MAFSVLWDILGERMSKPDGLQCRTDLDEFKKLCLNQFGKETIH
jgi:hypothetical protein